MIHYLLKRVLLMIPTLLGITVITVGIMLWAPGAPGVEQASQTMSGGGAKLQSSSAFNKAKEKMGFFDKDGNKLMFPVAWWNWTSKKLLRGDLGRSIKYKQKVTTLMADRIPITLLLNFISILIIYFVAIPVGIFSSVNQGTIKDGSTSTLLFIFYSIPSWWSATMLIVFFSSTIFFNWFPVIGLSSEGADRLPLLHFLWDRVQHMVLPITAMTLGGFAMLSRFMRSGMLETIRQDYIRTARAKGVAEHDVIYKHALRNALIPIITLLGGLLPAMIGGSIIIEQIFSIEGMGKLAFDAILARDYMVVMANTFFAAVLTLFGLLVSDILYVFVDPRISLD